ncbi:hypothetical protein CHS0354_004347 [Potamilus streckersoni]|uniref:Uncharacterized protein n=1 Tax=Potamilus streckersoni TaxID=2493646 RepID=A0AAE0VVA5_9BIVA|nr:hypothetical protein CHS0354_004347 [Potamilus streckersoni]
MMVPNIRPVTCRNFNNVRSLLISVLAKSPGNRLHVTIYKVQHEDGKGTRVTLHVNFFLPFSPFSWSKNSRKTKSQSTPVFPGLYSQALSSDSGSSL